MHAYIHRLCKFSRETWRHVLIIRPGDLTSFHSRYAHTCIHVCACVFTYDQHAELSGAYANKKYMHPYLNAYIHANTRILQAGEILFVTGAYIDDGWVVAVLNQRKGIAPCPYLYALPQVCSYMYINAHMYTNGDTSPGSG
jgi:hypothetical protein